jgi:hypothetical protein
MKKLAKLSPGRIFNFAGEKFVVMEQRDGSTFVLLAQSKESCPFNDKDDAENRNDYTRSTLKERIDKWVEALPRTSEEAAAILPFEVDLSCTDRSKSYGTITVKAAPLTLWQYGQFKELIPLNEDDWYWLVTPWACWWLRSPYTYNANYVWYVYSNGNCYYYYASSSLGIRPALLLNSDLLVSLDDEVEEDCCGECDCCGGNGLPSLDGISTATLLEEIQRRAMRAGSVFMGEDGTDE